jgi:pilus assembly protein Flp/PilA
LFHLLSEPYNQGIGSIFSWKEVNAMLPVVLEKGQGLVEYALILVLVALVVIVALMVLGPVIGNTFSMISSSLSSL